MRERWMSTLINITGLTVIAVAAIGRFGVLTGAAITFAVYLHMPWPPVGR